MRITRHIAPAFAICFGVGLLPACSQQTADVQQPAHPEPECAAPRPDPSDPLVGWFATSDGARLVPVLKHGAAYYSICRGFEVPFRPTPEGLLWDAEQSSMAGTTIGFDPATGARYLAVFDSQAAKFTDSASGVGEKQPLMRVDRPAWLRDPTTDPPRSLDDFLGWYEPVWFPHARWQLVREGDAYVVAYETRGVSCDDRREDVRYVLTPLAGRLGFTGFERGNRDITLAYNPELRRYELCMRPTCEIRMPLARIAPPATRPADDTSNIRVGIPSWH